MKERKKIRKNERKKGRKKERKGRKKEREENKERKNIVESFFIVIVIIEKERGEKVTSSVANVCQSRDCATALYDRPSYCSRVDYEQMVCPYLGLYRLFGIRIVLRLNFDFEPLYLIYGHRAL